MTSQEAFNASNILTQKTSYTSYDNLGNALTYTMGVYTGTNYTNTYNYTYAKFDTYKEALIAGTSTYFGPGNTTSSFDANGNLAQIVNTEHQWTGGDSLTTAWLLRRQHHPHPQLHQRRRWHRSA